MAKLDRKGKGENDMQKLLDDFAVFRKTFIAIWRCWYSFHHFQEWVAHFRYVRNYGSQI